MPIHSKLKREQDHKGYPCYQSSKKASKWVEPTCKATSQVLPEAYTFCVGHCHLDWTNPEGGTLALRHLLANNIHCKAEGVQQVDCEDDLTWAQAVGDLDKSSHLVIIQLSKDRDQQLDLVQRSLLQQQKQQGREGTAGAWTHRPPARTLQWATGSWCNQLCCSTVKHSAGCHRNGPSASELFCRDLTFLALSITSSHYTCAAACGCIAMDAFAAGCANRRSHC